MLKATEDDGPSLETPGIFCEVVGLVHLEVRGGQTPEVMNISKYPKDFLPTIVMVPEDDRPSFGFPIIFCDAVCLLLPLHPPMLDKDIAKLVQDHVVT
jgi:hypothetical protein